MNLFYFLIYIQLKLLKLFSLQMIQSKQVKNDERYVLFNLVQQIVQSEYTQTYLGHFIQQIARGVALSQYGQLRYI